MNALILTYYDSHNAIVDIHNKAKLRDKITIQLMSNNQTLYQPNNTITKPCLLTREIVGQNIASEGRKEYICDLFP